MDYFPLLVDFYEDSAYQFVNARFGLQGEAITNRLLGKIYREGYYIEFNDDYALLFALSVGDKGLYGLVKDVVYELLKRGFFDRSIFERFKVLTSKEIQDNYIRITLERLNLEIIKEYWLTEIPESTSKHKIDVQILDNSVNRPINTIYQPINTIYQPINTQRKVEKSKVKKSKESSSSLSTSNPKTAKPKQEEEEKIALVIKSYLDNISPTPSAIVYEEIKAWLTTVEPAVVIKAIEISVMNNGRSLNYIKHIVDDWICKGLTSEILVNAYLKDWERKKKGGKANDTNIKTECSKVRITEI